MQQIEPLDYGKFYHIYNRGINSCNVFYENANYHYFLKLYDKHISPVADTYAWVLMKNHFHFLVRIKEAPYLTGSKTCQVLTLLPRLTDIFQISLTLMQKLTIKPTPVTATYLNAPLKEN